MKRRTKSRILNDDFLEIRKSILDLAALLDRFDHAPDDDAAADPRLEQIREALATLTESDAPPCRGRAANLFARLRPELAKDTGCRHRTLNSSLRR